MSPELLMLVADRFKVLADPARLRLLSALRDGERTVTELVELTGLSQANTSKHLALLNTTGFVRKRKEGLFAYYALADRQIFKLCDIMCERLSVEVEGRARALAQ
jgi:DNA-binding transcriptional ArsR family regulator